MEESVTKGMHHCCGMKMHNIIHCGLQHVCAAHRQEASEMPVNIEQCF